MSIHTPSTIIVVIWLNLMVSLKLWRLSCKSKILYHSTVKLFLWSGFFKFYDWFLAKVGVCTSFLYKLYSAHVGNIVLMCKDDIYTVAVRSIFTLDLVVWLYRFCTDWVRLNVTDSVFDNVAGWLNVCHHCQIWKLGYILTTWPRITS